MSVFDSRSPKSDPEYLRHCEETLTPSFNSFVEMVEDLGWDGDVVAQALKSLAEANIKRRGPKMPAADTESLMKGSVH